MQGCVQKEVNYHADALYIYFNSEKNQEIKAIPYLSKSEGNVSGVENIAFKTYFNKDIGDIAKEIDDILTIDIYEWSINYEGAKIKVSFKDGLDSNKKIKIINEIKSRLSEKWYSGEVKYDYKE